MKMRDILEKAIDHYGPNHQITKAMEELAELLASLAKHQNQSGMMLNVIEEIADVKIMIGQLEIIFGQDLVKNKMDFKLMRLNKNIDSEIAENPRQDYHPHSQTLPFMDKG